MATTGSVHYGDAPALYGKARMQHLSDRELIDVLLFKAELELGGIAGASLDALLPNTRYTSFHPLQDKSFSGLHTFQPLSTSHEFPLTTDLALCDFHLESTRLTSPPMLPSVQLQPAWSDVQLDISSHPQVADDGLALEDDWCEVNPLSGTIPAPLGHLVFDDQRPFPTLVSPITPDETFELDKVDHATQIPLSYLDERSTNWSYEPFHAQSNKPGLPTPPSVERSVWTASTTATHTSQDSALKIRELDEDFPHSLGSANVPPGTHQQPVRAVPSSIPRLQPRPLSSSGERAVASTPGPPKLVIRGTAFAVAEASATPNLSTVDNNDVLLRARDATPSPKAIKYPQPQDWDRVKPVLKGMYVNNNMPLPDLMRYMEKKHDFHATINMYKKQFKNKWGWAKYSKTDDQKSGQQRRRKGGTCCRDVCLRRDGINRALTADGLLEIALQQWKMFLEVDFARNPGWIKGRPFHSMDLNTQLRCTEFYHGIAYLRRGQKKLGEKFIQHSLNTLRDRSSDLQIDMFRAYDLLLHSLRSMACQGLWSLMSPMLSFISDLALVIPRAGNLAQIASTLAKVLQLSRGHIIQFFGMGYQVLLGSITEAQGTTTTLSAEMRTYQLHACESLGTLTVDRVWAVRKQVEEFDHLAQRAEEEQDPDAARQNRDRAIWTQWSMFTYLENYAERCRSQIDCIVRSAGSPTSLADWNTTHLGTYINARIFFCAYLNTHDRGSIGPVLDDLKAALTEAARRGRSPPQALFDLCKELRNEGMTDLAAVIEPFVEQSQYYQKIAQVEQELQELSLFDATV